MIKFSVHIHLFFTAMGSPVSVVVANLYMEWWEQTALATCPSELRPSPWRRYVDDSYEKRKQGTTDRFTEHLNQVDPTGNIKVTFERESGHQVLQSGGWFSRSQSFPKEDAYWPIFELGFQPPPPSFCSWFENTSLSEAKILRLPPSINWIK